ncbi:MAG: hydrogenase formation protein HypD, partial [Planctomycetes bacterium]|nr:hydrogenase formation protein HypD [Planctomycetota bacterium]
VQVVYSPRDALKAARENPERNVVFLAIGFETTTPTVAATLLEAREENKGNFQVLCGHKTMPPALRSLLEAPEVALDGFILPGHVCTISGVEPFKFIPQEFGVPCCITGFEPGDILASILSLTELCVRGEPEVENTYGRAVRLDGNKKAQALIDRIMLSATARWRGVGVIPASGLDLGPKWNEYRLAPPDPNLVTPQSTACRCDEILRGLIRPPECPLFGKTCTPENPVGPCMVSSEGSCAAYHKYNRH